MLYWYIIAIVIALLICYKWGDWRHWNKYYPTIQFFIMGDYIYNILFRNNMLWVYVAPALNHTIINMIIGIFVYSSTVMVFIPYYPKGIIKQAAYVLLWVFICTVGEYIAHSLGLFAYVNGWNIAWSITFSTVMFSLLYLHYKKPLLAWVFAIIELIIYLIIFKVDILRLI
jgi:hypothetical protein